MNLSPTSRTLFLVQLGSFFSGIIVIVCCCLYLSAYPKSPDPGSVSAIACATLAFAIISTIITFILVIRQKSGRTINAVIEGSWVGLAAIIWILAAVGGIVKPANDMTNASCKVLPSGKHTDDKNYIRACQSMFASTAFCIVSALFFIATSIILVIFSIQSSIRERKAAKVKVGGSYELGPSPSEYRRAEEAGGSPTMDIEATSPSTDHATTVLGSSMLTPATVSTGTTGGFFSENAYQEPVISTPASIAVTRQNSGTPSPYNTYPASGYVPQGNMTVGGYSLTGSAHNINNRDYIGQGTGHIPQASVASNLSVSNYDQYYPNPYANSGIATTTTTTTSMYPPLPQQHHQHYSTLGPSRPQSPYGTRYSNQEHNIPIMEMPRPEHFD
ncbi:hypothetical protein BGZ46_009578 [Entomortierella lignicola]|nr:hypothetical protein BGZ46_009578 [Entomortierella lignicola]